MAHLIDKDALVAKIEKLKNFYKKCPTHNSYDEGLKVGRLIGYKDALHKINILEEKEVDLEEYIENEVKHYGLSLYEASYGTFSASQIDRIIRNAFELGLKAKQG